MTCLKCPNCRKIQPVKSLETRKRRGKTSRRRLCVGCGHHFSTYETLEPSTQLGEDLAENLSPL